jgi:Family of unknown function (DUF5343)
MVAVKENVSYIMFPSSYWWGLRKKFNQSVPARVTEGFLAGVLGIGANTAKITVIPPLKKMGLIDSDGKPTERAIRWRDDGQYPDVCAEIRSELYPQELLDTFSGDDAPRTAVENWFARTGVGRSASTKMASFYLLLAEANPVKQDGTSSTAKTPKTARTSTQAAKANTASAKRPTAVKSNGNAQVSMQQEQAELIYPHPPQNGSRITPSLHIDIQIHISPDASPEQIESIFSSMARHLYKENSVNE